MGADCYLVWREDEELNLEAVFLTQDNAEEYIEQRMEFVIGWMDTPVFHITELPGGLYEQDAMP